MRATWEPTGAPRGRVVLLHGMMSSAATWWRVGPALAARGWRVEALDLPAHGDSPRLGRPLSVDALADGVAGQITEPPDLLVGHSLGAITALAVAARGRPAIRALALEDPPSAVAAADQVLLEGVVRDAALARSDRDAVVRREQEANPRWLPEDVEHSVDGIASADVAAITGGLAGPLRWDLPDLAAGFDGPTLLMAAPEGPGDFVGGVRSALQDPDRAWWRDRLPAERFAVLDGGHCLHRDQPDRWVAEVDAFATEVVR